MIKTKVRIKYKPEWLAHEMTATAEHRDCDDVFYYSRLIEIDPVSLNPSIIDFYIEDIIYKFQQAFKDKGLSYE
jgi:hypothetical protein